MNRFLVLSLLFCAPFWSVAQAQESDDCRVRLLFAGSSSMYWNDLPDAVGQVVSKKVSGKEGCLATAELVGRSGDDIRVYLQPGFDNYQYGVRPGQTFLEKVQAEKFDFVTMMVFTRFIMETGPSLAESKHAKAVTTYCQAIRAAGGEPVFYESGWGDAHLHEEGRKRILELAKQNNVTHFAPCSSAWARVAKDRPDLKLQDPHDPVHPGNLGHFLNMACFYAALTKQSPVGQLPRTFPVWHHWGEKEREQQKAALDDAFAKFEPNPYQKRLPKWMQAYASAGLTETLSDEDARYLETVAWNTWQKTQRALTQVQED
ncbi:hypothetical protein [Bremerella sp.]|uniref:hypothetical protein n=1 Tax=Bremerella sp. TaxID=2795602 RepID=UPI00391D9B53